jgi:hypothetical protein
LTRIGTDPAQIKKILADYPDPIDLTVAEPALFAKYGITEETLTDRMGGQPMTPRDRRPAGQRAVEQAPRRLRRFSVNAART